MQIDTYEQSYVEVLEILKHIPKEEYVRIPKEKLDFFNKHKDQEYKFVFDAKNINISRKTYAIIINLYNEYIATENQKKIVDDFLQYNTLQAEKVKAEKYNTNNIFKIKNQNYNDNFKKQNALININENQRNFFYKIIKFIKKVFKTNK